MKKVRKILPFIITIIVTSTFWILAARYTIDRSQEHKFDMIFDLMKTMSKQYVIINKTGEIMTISAESLQSGCFKDSNCLQEVTLKVNSLRTEVEKEKEDIGNIWDNDVFYQKMQNYIDSLTDEQEMELEHMLEVYFPEEVEGNDGSLELL